MIKHTKKTISGVTVPILHESTNSCMRDNLPIFPLVNHHCPIHHWLSANDHSFPISMLIERYIIEKVKVFALLA